MKKVMVSLIAALLSSWSLAAVNINTATMNELTALPNIGEGKAKAIIEYREANGKFQAIENLMDVKGIGEKIFEKIKVDLIVEGETDLSNLQSTQAKSEPATAEQPAQNAKTEKTAKPAKSEQSTKSAKPEPAGKSEKSEQPTKS